MISVVILAKNSEKHLADVLQALSRFQEVIVFDTGSTDATIPIARRFANVSVHEGDFAGFGKTRNVAALCAKNDWILAIDSDEIASPELVNEILSLTLEPHAVYSFWRKNFFRGKFIKGCSWYPDRQIRLYHRGDTQFSSALVHESVVVGTNRHVELKGYVVHYPYADMGDFLAKMQSYSALFANEWRGKKKGGLASALSHGFWSFFKSYILKKGIFLGSEGFIISLYNGHTAYYKYLKLQEANEGTSAGSPRQRQTSDSP